MDSKLNLPNSVTVEADGPLRIVTLNRPDQLNAVNAEMHWALANVWRQIRADREAQVVIVTGAGKAFCAGGDFGWLEALGGDAVQQDITIDEGGEIITEMLRFPLPVIAAVNGPAVGLGCSVAVMCDIVLIDEKAHMSDPHVAVGLVAGDGGAAIWPAVTNVLRTKESLFLGSRFTAAEAVEVGLATRVVANGEAMTEARAVAAKLLALPQRALQDTKRAINAHLIKAVAGPMHVALSGERMSMGSPEHAELLDKFRPRKP